MFDDFQEIFSTLRKNKLRHSWRDFPWPGNFHAYSIVRSGNGLRTVFCSILPIWLPTLSNWARKNVRGLPGFCRRADVSSWTVPKGLILKMNLNRFQIFLPDHPIQSEFLLQGDYAPGVLQGVMPDYRSIETVKIRQGNGRFINTADIRQARKVIGVLHSRTAELLFKEEKPLGKFITYDKRHVPGDWYLPRQQYVPESQQLHSSYNGPVDFTTRKRVFTGSHVAQRTGNDGRNEVFEDNLRGALGRKHRFDREDRSAIYLFNITREYIQFKRNFQRDNVICVDYRVRNLDSRGGWHQQHHVDYS